MTQAENTIELPNRMPGRAARIAAVRMFADWLEQHPDVPVPNITATYFVNPEDEPDQETRFREIMLLGERLGAVEYGMEYGNGPQFDHQVASRQVHGISIIYRGSAFPDEHYAERL
jgi:hypothetical protein